MNLLCSYNNPGKVRLIISFLLLVTWFETVRTSDSTEGLEDNSIEQEQVPVISSETLCSCLKELNDVKDRLERLERAFTTYKETEIHRIHDLNKRIQLMTQGVENKNEQAIRAQSNYIQEHILDDVILDRIVESLWLSLEKQPSSFLTLEKALKSYRLVLRNSFPNLYIRLFSTLFDYLDSSNKIEDRYDLEEIAKVLGDILKDNKATLKASPFWTKDLEIKLLNRLVVNVYKVIPSIEDESWSTLSTLLGARLYPHLAKLSRVEALDVVIATMESQNEGKLLSSSQLNYVKYLYYESIPTIYRSVHSPVLPEDYETWKGIFSRPLILDSLDQDIIYQLTRNGTTPLTADVSYIVSWTRGRDSVALEVLPELDILNRRIALAFLQAMQDNSMTYDPLSPQFLELLRAFQHYPDILPRFPFLKDDVKTLVFNKYTSLDQFQATVDFILKLDPHFKYPALKQLLSSMRESQQLNQNEVFSLAKILVDSNLRNDSIWNELPQQAQLLADYSNAAGLIWRVRLKKEGDSEDEPPALYDILLNQDFSLGLKPHKTAGEEEEEAEADIEADQSPTGTRWIFDVNQGNFPLKLSVQGSDIVFRGGLVLNTPDSGVQLLRHARDYRDRRNGLFAVFTPLLAPSGETFILVFRQGAPLQVLFDDSGLPFGLGIAESGGGGVANFVVSSQ